MTTLPNVRGKESAPLSFDHALWEHYTVFDGLAGMRVEDLHQDGDGFLWVATADGGVSRFDGVHFDNLTEADGLPHPTVMAIAETGDGRVWFGTFGGGLAAWDGRAFQVYTTAHGLPSDEILGLRPGPEDTLWVLTVRGAVRWAHDHCVQTIDQVGGEPAGLIYDLAQDQQGRLWLATLGRGVISADGQRLSDPGPGGEERLVWAWKLAIDGQDRLWIAPKYTGSEVYVYCCDSRTGQLARVQVGQDLHPRPVKHGIGHVRCDAQDRVWIAHRGVTVLDGAVWKRLNLPFHANSLSDTKLTYEDQEGNVWVGFWGGGLAFCDMWSVQRFTEADGLPDEEVTCLAEDQQGRRWIGTMKGMARQQDGCLESMPARAGWPGDMVLSLAADRKGQVWWGTDQGQVWRWDGQQLRDIAIAPGEQEIKLLHQDQQGRLWVGTYTSGELGWLEEGEFRRLEAHLPWLQVLAEDQEGRLWIGRHGETPSLYCYEGGQVRPVEGLAAQSPYVYALAQTPDRTLWIGTGTGLLACRGGQVQRFTTREGLSENAVSALAVDAAGVLWIGTAGGGVVRYDGRGFQVVRLGDTPAENVVEAILVDRQGGLWCGTRAGLAHYRPGHTPPRVVIRQVLAGGRHWEPEQVDCAATVPEVRIQFQGIGFRAGARQMRYRHRLRGLARAEEWSGFTGDTEAVYSGMDPGDYCFEVQALDRDGLSSAPAALPLRITPDPREDHLEALGQVLGSAGQPLIGRSAALAQVLAQVEEVGRTRVTVLILGETGTGKGLAARLLHQASPRQDRPFIHVNCGSLPEGLIASELFGHERGAFTGAVSRRLGRFELADGGTLFLDEIGDLPLDSQQVLLQVLEEGCLQRVGGQETLRVDVRVVAATNRRLEEAVAQGSFRADLFYRLNQFTLEMPPLRERQEDIPLLVGYFVERFARHLNRPVPAVRPEALARLQEYSWPGNVRELEHLVQRAVLGCRGPVIGAEDMPLHPGLAGPWPEGAEGLSLEEYERRWEEQEKQYLVRALEAAGWVIYGEQGAARRLGVHPEKLRARLKKYGLRRPG